MVIVIYEKSVRLIHLLICILLVIPLRQHIRFLCLHDGISLTSEFPGNFDDCPLRIHALTTVGVIASQLIVSVNGNPTCLYDKWAELFVASESLHSIGLFLAIYRGDRPHDTK